MPVAPANCFPTAESALVQSVFVVLSFEYFEVVFVS